MGAAMAAAAADTILTHFADTGRTPPEFDLIVTGDLGAVGSELLIDLVGRKGHDISKNHRDCGIEIYDPKTQDTHAGGSGCGCAAVTFAAKYYEELKSGKINRILFCPTGALMSPTSAQQGQSIPSISHAVELVKTGILG